MASALPQHEMTVEEYLTWAEGRPGRYELYAGTVYAMSPERAGHAKVKFTIQSALLAGIRRANLPCHMLPDGMTIRIDRHTAYEPDGLVYCGERLPDSSLEVPNPMVLVEVISRSTKHTDAGAKLIGYFSLPSVKHYLIVDPDEAVVIHHGRDNSETIVTRILREGTLHLDPPGIDLQLAEIFAELLIAMLVLAIDTAGPNCAVAIAKSDGAAADILARQEESIGRGHADLLMPMIEEVLTQAGVGFKELARIAVTIGPGSFTGVRVGIAAARGLALALDIPAVGVGSLAALALPAARRHPDGTVVATLDAKRGEVFVFARAASTDAVLMPASALAPDEAAVRIATLAHPLILTGSGALLLSSRLGDALVDGTADVPDIADVATLGLREEAESPPVPLYARGADARPQSDKAILRR